MFPSVDESSPSRGGSKKIESILNCAKSISFYLLNDLTPLNASKVSLPDNLPV